MIKYTEFKHPWPYHYYIDIEKTHLLTPKDLHEFMVDMLSNCPHEKFLSGPRSSALKMKSLAKPIEVKCNDVCRLAKEGLDWGAQGTAHGNVQLHMLKNDPKTIGVEIPLWLDQDEYNKMGLKFKEDGPISGHIDVVRIEDDKIWIWDFKPKAHKEKYADMQVLMYATILSHRTNIPLDEFRCGYFDENTSYVFKPTIDMINPLKEINAD